MNTNGTPENGDKEWHGRHKWACQCGCWLVSKAISITMKGALRLVIASCLAVIVLPGGANAVGAWFVPPAGVARQGEQGAQSAHDLAHGLAGMRWNQVRIEQHLIIRITPGNQAVMRDLPPPAPEPLPVRLKERRTSPCVPVAAIAGVRPLAGDRLLLILRDHRLLGADLSRSCAARDFYMGFYLNPTPDGMLCKNRDTIHSRSGTTCTITRVHALVPAN